LIIFPVLRNFYPFLSFLFGELSDVVREKAEISYPSIYDSEFALGVIFDEELLDSFVNIHAIFTKTKNKSYFSRIAICVNEKFHRSSSPG
jgi:hypothetical protein